MIFSLIKKLIGSRNDRQLKRMRKIVKSINDFEPLLSELTDEELKYKTQEFKDLFQRGTSLNDILIEAFAVVREASRRCMNMRHFDVQMIGGIALHEGSISEMRTGEGKTLMATLPAYLNAITGKGVHVITVNDYLAERDANWMRTLYEFLGLSISVVINNQTIEEKKKAYQADITYGTNNEFGFDYLRDNMAFRQEDKMQRGLHYAIIDEVDSILIDEARTPLVISGPTEDSSELYRKINGLVPRLEIQKEVIEEGQEPTGHYIVDEKNKSIELTEKGHLFVENLLQEVDLLKQEESLYAPQNLLLLHHITASLKAHVLFTRNVEYIVKNDKIILIDEHTGRTMQGRRLSDGLHQAIEAKEKVKIESESQTMASTTFQNYFRIYEKLSGMTGTADTEAFELRQIYNLDVIVIPTHKPMIREDYNDLVYMSIEEKYNAIIKDIIEKVKEKRPILVGTASIESSERLSKALKKSGIKHNVLNAKFHDKEAEIIAQAGKTASVTIATNMAGRGTDIVLGGNLKSEISQLENPKESKIIEIKKAWNHQHKSVIDAGGLHVIGTERHESRRIDNQLRGRSGRQGDPGSSRFYLSLEDNLMRIFASDRVKGFMKALGMEKGEAIEHRMVSNAIEKAQRKVENRNFDIRKQLLEYDDVANDQRKVVYAERNKLLSKQDVTENIRSMRNTVLKSIFERFVPLQSMEEQWDIVNLEKELKDDFNIVVPIKYWIEQDNQLDEELLLEKIVQFIEQHYQKAWSLIGQEECQKLEKHIMLKSLDDKWKEHLAMMDHLRQGIHLRGYAQKNPKQEYKREAFDLFQYMLYEIKFGVIKTLSHINIQPEQNIDFFQKRQANKNRGMNFVHKELEDKNEEEAKNNNKPFVRETQKIGRNQLCPCGSGKKYKHCHGVIF